MVQSVQVPAPAHAPDQARHPQWAFFEGEIVPIEGAKISIMTQVINYGLGAFGGLRGYWNDEKQQLYVFRVEKHFGRFLNSCKLFNTSIPYSIDDLKRITIDLLRREGYREDAYIRPLLYNSTEDITPRLYDVTFDFACFTRALGNYIKLEVKACTSSWRRLDDNIIPSRGKITGGYVNSALARSEAYWNGYDESIVLNQDGHIAEGSAENLFVVRDGKLHTPAFADNILEGITRSTVIQLARAELGLEVVEREVDRSELYVAEEAFFCGTGAQVSAIVEVDNRKIGSGQTGPVTKSLQQAYFDVVRGKNTKYADWLTPVYD